VFVTVLALFLLLLYGLPVHEDFVLGSKAFIELPLTLGGFQGILIVLPAALHPAFIFIELLSRFPFSAFALHFCGQPFSLVLARFSKFAAVPKRFKNFTTEWRRVSISCKIGAAESGIRDPAVCGDFF